MVQRQIIILLLKVDYFFILTGALSCQSPFIQTYLTNTLKAPNGVTRIAGAKAYAVKLAISPTITENKILQ